MVCDDVDALHLLSYFKLLLLNNLWYWLCHLVL